MQRALRHIFLCFALLLLLYPDLWAAEPRRVLFISAYHPAFPTFFQQVEGIKAVFENKSILLDIEFMDSKRFPDQENLANFYRSLANKLSRTQAYDALISGDDNALSFILEHQQDLFPNLPIVFLGVNNQALALAQNSNPAITGVVEAVSMQETLELMLQLHPGTKRIIALVDGTPSGQADLITFYQYKDSFAPVTLTEMSLAALSFEELATQLKNLGDEDLVLLLSAYRDKHGKSLLFYKSLHLIKKNLSRPLYHLWTHGIGEGVLGGKVISHVEQGKTAAKITLEILAGRTAGDTPVTLASPNSYVFDDRELQRFGLNRSDLPQGSTVQEEPQSYFQEHQELFWSAFVIFCGYSLLVIAMWANTLRRKRVERELLRNQYYLNKAQEIGMIGTWELDVLSGRLVWTAESCRIFGVPPDSMVDYELFMEKVHPDDRVYVEREWYAAMQGKAYDIEHRIVVAAETKWVRQKADVTFDENGNAASAIGFVQDVTARLKTEMALRESEERFRSIFESAAAPMGIFSVTGSLLQVNPAACQLTGYREEELLKLKIGDLIHPDDRDFNRSIYAEVVSGKRKLASYENRYLSKGGSTIWGHSTLTPVRDSKGSLLYLVGLAQDITERKRAEEALKYALSNAEEARDKIEAILTSVADGLIFTDMDNRIILMSASAEAMLGKQSSELFMQPLAAALPGQSAGEIAPTSLASSGKTVNLKLDPAARLQDQGRSIQVKSSLVRGVSGGKEGVITLLRDVSRELELDQMKNEFISTAAHELRTPLTSVKGYAELLLSDLTLDEQQQAKFLAIINEKADLLTRIVDDLLNLSRVESGRVIYLKKAWQDLVPALAEQISRYRHEWKTHRFEQDFPEKPVLLMLDLDKFTQVMENLLSNAVKYSGDGSLIHTSCEHSENQVQISVRDQGYGMTAGQLARVFDKFYRVNASNTAKEGLGLGMSIAKNIIEAHGGRIWVESELDRGTTVNFTIPLDPQTDNNQGRGTSSEDDTDC